MSTSKQNIYIHILVKGCLSNKHVISLLWCCSIFIESQCWHIMADLCRTTSTVTINNKVCLITLGREETGLQGTKCGRAAEMAAILEQ